MNNVECWREDCSGCGICVAVCPVKAITLEKENGFLRPKINDLCVNCGKCIAMCPNVKQDACDYNFFAERIWGHSCNQDVRREAASGGVTSELLHYLMRRNFVDYVITAEQYDNKSVCTICEPDLIDIYEKAGSNYCPVDMSGVIEKIRQKEGVCAVVCLPCYARGLRTLMSEDAELSAKIKYIIALLCNHLPSYHATEYLLKRYRIKETDSIKYRGDGWFGNFRVYKKGETGGFDTFYRVFFDRIFSIFLAECLRKM